MGRTRDPEDERREFGSVARRVRDGRTFFEASYPLDGHRGGRRRSKSFPSERAADKWLFEQAAAMGRGELVDPRAGKMTLVAYADTWLAQAVHLEVRTAETYADQMRLIFGPPRPRRTKGSAAAKAPSTRIVAPPPYLGELALNRITTPHVRAWLAQAKADGATPHMMARALQRLRQILYVAVEDKVLPKNPAKYKNSPTEYHAPRPDSSFDEIDRVVAALPERLLTVALLAAWGQLRKGELFGLRRQDIDLAFGGLWVMRAAVQPKNAPRYEKTPKGKDKRFLTLAADVLPTLELHLEQFTGPEPGALLFTGVKGGPLRPAALQKEWEKARKSIGRPDLHFHDLRGFGATRLAELGASTRYLMLRLGHNTSAASLRYQHSVEERNHDLVERLAAERRRSAAGITSLDDVRRARQAEDAPNPQVETVRKDVVRGATLDGMDGSTRLIAWTEFVDEEAVIERFGRTRKTIKRWVDGGLLPAHTDPGGRRWYHPDDLAAFLARSSEQVQQAG